MRKLFLLPILILSALAVSQTAATPFIDVVKAHFSEWDSDKSGSIDGNEIELALSNLLNKGEVAAAVASVRRVLKGKTTVPSLSLKDIEDALTPEKMKEAATPKYESSYRAALKKINEASRDLFVSGKPSLDSLAQGRMGDCFVMAVIGDIAERDAGRLVKAIKKLDNGKLEVTLSKDKSVTIDSPTDGEIAVGSTTKKDGLWSLVYEKAVGTVQLEVQKTKKHLTAFSQIGRGGSTGTVMSLFTGKKSKRISCAPFRKNELTPEKAEEMMADLRKALTDAFASGRLVAGGVPSTGDNKKVPGINTKHAYAVLGYDAATDTVKFWNPHGNTFKPKGDPGIENGYPTSHGRFSAPLKEVVLWFGAFAIEPE